MKRIGPRGVSFILGMSKLMLPLTLTLDVRGAFHHTEEPEKMK